MRNAIESLPMPSTYLELALQEFGAAPQARAAILEGTDLGVTEPGGEITVGQQLQVIRNLQVREEPGWALRLGRRFVPATHGAVGFAAVSAPTLAAGISVMERFAHVRVPLFRFHSRQDGARFVLGVEERMALSVTERVPLLEMLLASVQGLVELVLGRPMHEAVVRLAYAPLPCGEQYAEHFHGHLRFGAGESALAIPSRWLDQSCPTADPSMYENALKQLEALERRLESDDYIVARVAQLIASSEGLRLSSAEAADRLHVSERTLIRRLRRGGTTYRELLDAHRREQAQALLRDPYLEIAEVCHRLGYGDVANFGRACRRWFGAGPQTYRRQILADADSPSTDRPPGTPVQA